MCAAEERKRGKGSERRLDWVVEVGAREVRGVEGRKETRCRCQCFQNIVASAVEREFGKTTGEVHLRGMNGDLEAFVLVKEDPRVCCGRMTDDAARGSRMF